LHDAVMRRVTRCEGGRSFRKGDRPSRVPGPGCPGERALTLHFSRSRVLVGALPTLFRSRGVVRRALVLAVVAGLWGCGRGSGEEVRGRGLKPASFSSAEQAGLYASAVSGSF